MARTASAMLALQTQAPDFNLPNVVTNTQTKFKDIKGEKATVVAFICNHCPFVIHINPTLIALAKKYQEKGIGFVAISANDADAYPADAPEKMKEQALTLPYPFAYLYDQSQETAKAYSATCTPDFFVFDAKDKLVYRGQLDSSRPENGKICDGKDLSDALDAIIDGKAVCNKQKPSIGCNIKWKS